MAFYRQDPTLDGIPVLTSLVKGLPPLLTAPVSTGKIFADESDESSVSGTGLHPHLYKMRACVEVFQRSSPAVPQPEMLDPVLGQAT